MSASKRFSLSNIPGRDDDVEEADIRHERELRRRIRESDPLYAQKRMEAQQQAAKEKRQKQQASRGMLFPASTTSLPTPEQAVLAREQEGRVLSPEGRSQLLLRQSANVNPYLSSTPKNTKKTFAKWTEVAQSTDAEQAILNKQHHIMADVILRHADEADSSGISEEIGNLIEKGILSPEAVRSFEDSDINPQNSAKKNQQQNTGSGNDRKKPSFVPEPSLTHKFARRCVEVSRKTASIRYRDICNAKTADEMGALGIDPEIMGNFNSFGTDDDSLKKKKNELEDNSAIARYHREREKAMEEQRRLRNIPALPDDFDGVPVRGDSHSRLLAYRKEKERDKMVSAQRRLITQQAREQQEKELARKGVDVSSLNTKKSDTGADDDDDDDKNRNRLGANKTPLLADYDTMRDCAVYLDDEDEAAKRAADPGYPLPMHLGTADRSRIGNNNSDNSIDYSFSGIDPSATDNEDLIILTTPSLRLASKVVLQCVFSLQASDLRDSSIPTVPLVQYIPIRQCPVFVQKTHTVMMHEIKRQLRNNKAVQNNTFVVWTRVLLPRSNDPEDDIVAADDCHVEQMAAHDESLPAVNGQMTPSRRRGGGPNSSLPPTSPSFGGGGSTARKKMPHEYAGGTTLDQPDSSNALLSGSSTVDMMVMTSPFSPSSKNNNSNNKSQQQSFFAVSPNDITFAQIQHQLQQEEQDMLKAGASGGKSHHQHKPAAAGENETAAQRLFRHRMSPALPVLVRAPRPILTKPPERELFVEPAAPTAADIANEFKEFTSAIRPILESDPDPAGASKLDYDHVPTPPAELIMDEEDDDSGDENYESDNNEGQEEEDYIDEYGITRTRTIYAPRPKRIKKSPARRQSTTSNNSASGNSKMPQETGADDWKATKRVAAELDMEEVYEPMRNPTALEMNALIADQSPFEKYEHAAMTAKAITTKLRDSAEYSREAKKMKIPETSENERLKFRLFEALEFIKKHVLDGTTKMARADSQVEFRFKMQEAIVKRESDGTLFETAAKSVLNADQRIIMLEKRIASDIEDMQYTWNRKQHITHNIAREREERSVSSRQQSPQHYQSSPTGGSRHHSPVGNVNRVGGGSRYPSATAFKPAPQPQSLPAQLRRPVHPVALKYAKPGETAPTSLTQFLEHQREGSFERPASQIQPEVPSPEKVKMHEPAASDVNDNDNESGANNRKKKTFDENEEEQDDDVAVLVSSD